MRNVNNKLRKNIAFYRLSMMEIKTTRLLNKVWLWVFTNILQTKQVTPIIFYMIKATCFRQRLYACKKDI
jgi:hypothetical protein